MEVRKVAIPSDPSTNRRHFEVITCEGAVSNTVFINIHDVIEGQTLNRGIIGGWFTKEALDDLITVLQFAKLERFGNDEA